jgi:hypothetical protein
MGLRIVADIKSCQWVVTICSKRNNFVILSVYKTFLKACNFNILVHKPWTSEWKAPVNYRQTDICQHVQVLWAHILIISTIVIMWTRVKVLDFKLLPCFEYCICSFGYFPGWTPSQEWRCLAYSEGILTLNDPEDGGTVLLQNFNYLPVTC